ncbi:MAG: hypothetical protein IJZ34_07120 [Lachnospiraceae bacterium]|nr:hypothetical protein [Lachnospiraceae bacterium]MBQ8879070.1 hypothetical protein [Lachnospiraceae bacterium]
MSLKISFRNDLYRSDSITEDDLAQIKRDLKKKPFFTNVYIVIPAGNQKDMIEFFHSRQLAQPYYWEREIHVLGVTRTYREAVLMVRKLVQECLDERGDCALREYLSC